MAKKRGYVYIMTNRKYGMFYVGMTSDLKDRIHEHKHDLVDGYTKRHQLHQLVYIEEHQLIASAIKREKVLKKWKRTWKIELIEKMNPQWRDLYSLLT